MAEPFCHHLDRYPFFEEQCGVGVPELVEGEGGDIGAVDDPIERP
jgi:hypothetical protein